MTQEDILSRLRLFLLGLSAFLCAGTIIELWFDEHTGTPIQLLPFILAGVGLLAAILAIVRPNPSSLMTLRGVMVVLIFGSVLGIYEHITHNLAFELDIRPNAAAGEVLLEALHGASPLLAPGVLALAALVALAATYYHPVLNGKR